MDGALARQYVTVDAIKTTLAVSHVCRLSDVESVTHRKDGALARQYGNADAIKTTSPVSIGSPMLSLSHTERTVF